MLALPVLFGICPRSRWSPLFPLHALALIPLSLAKVRLSHILTLSPLMIWYSGQTALFLFLLARAAGPVCSSFSAEACAILHALCLSRPYQQVCHFSSLFLLSDSRSVLATLSAPHHFSYLKLCGRSGRYYLLSPSVLLDNNGSPDTRFSRGTTRLKSLQDGVRYLRPPQSLVVSLLLSLVSTLVFFRTGGVLSLQSILTHRFPQFPLRNLCSLVMLAVSSFVFAAMDSAFF